MANDLFSKVREAEQKAEVILGEAQREALKLVKDAEADCADGERNAAREHRALYQSILEKKREEVAGELEQSAQMQRAQIDKQMADARGRLPDAVKCIAERVMNDGNR